MNGVLSRARSLARSLFSMNRREQSDFSLSPAFVLLPVPGVLVSYVMCMCILHCHRSHMNWRVAGELRSRNFVHKNLILYLLFFFLFVIAAETLIK